MTEIREMYDLVKKLLWRRDPAYNSLVKKQSASGKLLAIIAGNDGISDIEAAERLYSEIDDENQRMKLFRKQKYKLTNGLIRALCFLNLNHTSSSEYLVAAYSAKRELLAAELALWMQSHHAMHFIVKRVLKKAAKYHLTKELLRCYEMLRYHSYNSGSKSDCLTYTTLVEKTFEVLDAEIWASNLKARVRAELIGQIALRPDAVKTFLPAVEKLEELTLKHNTRNLWHNYSLVSGIVLRNDGNIQQALSVYDKHFNFLESNSHLSSSERISQICFYALRCSLIARDYEQAKKFAERGLQGQEVGTLSWFAHMSLHVILLMHTRRWKVAGELFQWAVRHPNFHKEPQRIELWSVYEGYIRFFCDESHLLPDNVTVHGSMFHLNHLLEEVNLARQDKSGLNIALLIFQVLHRLKERQFGLLETRIKSLENYAYNHMRNEDCSRFIRTKRLFKLISLLPSCHYNLAKIGSRAKADYVKLRDILQIDHMRVQQIEEIVPYEHIWERVLIELKQIEQEGHFVKEYRGAYQSAP